MPNLASNANLNTIVETGAYIGPSGNSISNKPAGIGTSSFMLVVSAPGTGSGSGNRFILQEIFRLSDPTDTWIRRLDQQVPSNIGPWTKPEAYAPPASRLAGKKAVFFGDSITDFSDHHVRVQEALGLSLSVNAGFGGQRMSLHPTPVYQPFSMYALAQTIAAGNSASIVTAANTLFSSTGADLREPAADLAAVDFSTVDFAVIFYGTNDFGGSAAIGSPGDTSSSTLRGAINITITELQSAFPQLQFLFMTPMWRARQASGDGKDATNYPNSAGLYLAQYVDAIMDEAGRRGCPVLDMYRTSGVNSATHSTLLDDGLHARTDAGKQRIADKITAAMLANF